MRHGARPCEIFLFRIGIAGDDFLHLTIGAHGPPFIVVALEPDFAEVGKLAVVGNLRGRKVVVVIENRLVGSVLVVELLRVVGGEEEIFVDE